jgi:hypothetical protein
MSRTIRVVFINANTGEVIGRSDMPLEQLPESFDIATTLQIGQTSWEVDRAEPATSQEFERSGQLELLLRPVEMVAPKDILYSLPTICGDLPAVDAQLDRSRCFVLHEDDWRQLEFVSADRMDAVAEECEAIRRVYADHAHELGEMTAFDAIHVRRGLPSPITTPLPFDDLVALLPPAVRSYGGVSFRDGTGAVPGGFALGLEGCVVYGIVFPDGVHILGVHGQDVSATEPLRSLGLSLVDWVAAEVA